MAAAGGKPYDDILTCSFCMNVLHQPITLACQHNFCQNCLRKYLDNQKKAVKKKFIPCPTCGQETPVPRPDRPVEEWAGKLKLPLTGLMDTVAKGLDACLVCREEVKTTEATQRCSEFDASFCDVDAIRAQRTEVKTKLRERQQNFFDSLNAEGKRYDDQTKQLLSQRSKLETKIRKIIRHAVDVFDEKEYQLIEKVNYLTELNREELGSMKKTKQIDLQMYQHQSQFIQQVLEIEDEAELIEMYLSSGQEAEIDGTVEQRKVRTDDADKANISFLHDFDDLKKQIKTMNVKIRTLSLKSEQIDRENTTAAPVNLAASPELDEVFIVKRDDEERLLEMYMSSGSEAGADVTVRKKNRICAAEISFIHNLDKPKKGIEAMGVKINQLNLTASPELDEVNNAKLSELDSYYITDVLVMYIADTKFTLLADYYNRHLMSFYTKGGESYSRLLKVSGFPWCITLISDDKVAVSLPVSRDIITVAVTPGLELLSTMHTSKKYSGLSTLDQSTLVAGSSDPSSVDLINMEGNILKTFTTLPGIGKGFITPHFIHVTKQGTILVSDCNLNTVVCLTRSGDIVFTNTPTGNRALRNARGITATSTGDILVADHTKNKVIRLSESGEFIGEILTVEDGLHSPTGLCVDGDKLCVALRYTGLHEYRLCYTPLIPGTGRPVQL